jgi:hypothetical protein
MDKVVWKIFEPVIRDHLVQKYVPKEPIDPLVIQIVALYWMFQELVKFWKTKQRLTFEQKKKVLHLLIWNLSRVQQEQASYNEYQSDAGIETLTEDESFRDVVFGEEEYDTAVSSETAEQIAQLVLACKEFA